MTDRQVWLITGAGRGMGASFAAAALAAGRAVVATGRRPDEVAAALGDTDHLLVTALDVTDHAGAAAAAVAAVERFGRIDVLVNNVGASFTGYFEEMAPGQVEQQLAVDLLGPMNVTRAVLPVMRRQRSGLVVTISSGAGLVGFEYSSVYAAAKAGVEGWMCRRRRSRPAEDRGVAGGHRRRPAAPGVAHLRRADPAGVIRQDR